jgi:hypothetical protein
VRLASKFSKSANEKDVKNAQEKSYKQNKFDELE